MSIFNQPLAGVKSTASKKTPESIRGFYVLCLMWAYDITYPAESADRDACPRVTLTCLVRFEDLLLSAKTVHAFKTLAHAHTSAN